MSEDGDRKVSLIIISVLVIIALAAAAGVIVFFYHFNGDSFDFSDTEILTVPTGSMDGEPQDYPISTIPKHSLIMVHLLDDEGKKDLKVGDVITFHQDGLKKVHRIISIPGDGTLVTKGDANQGPDAAITYDDVLGKVVGVAPTVGKVVSEAKDLIKSPILIVIGILLLIIMIVTIREIIGIIREKPDEKQEP